VKWSDKWLERERIFFFISLYFFPSLEISTFVDDYLIFVPEKRDSFTPAFSWMWGRIQSRKEVLELFYEVSSWAELNSNEELKEQIRKTLSLSLVNGRTSSTERLSDWVKDCERETEIGGDIPISVTTLLCSLNTSSLSLLSSTTFTQNEGVNRILIESIVLVVPKERIWQILIPWFLSLPSVVRTVSIEHNLSLVCHSFLTASCWSF
jgi:hypothetical protein